MVIGVRVLPLSLVARIARVPLLTRRRGSVMPVLRLRRIVLEDEALVWILLLLPHRVIVGNPGELVGHSCRCWVLVIAGPV